MIRRRGQVSYLPFGFFRLGLVLVGVGLLMASVMGPWVATSHAQAPTGSYDEAEAQSIDRMLMCPVCPAESIDQAQVALARQMRLRVREMLAEGATRQEILDYFADRYGQNVLASPPKSGINLLAWTLPVAMVLAALGGGFFVLKAITNRNDAAPGISTSGISAPGPESEEGDLEPYLEAVDRSLAIDDKLDSSGEEDPGERSGSA